MRYRHEIEPAGGRSRKAISYTSALVAFIPEKKWGVVILANRAGFTPLVELKFKIFDLLLEGKIQ